MVYYVFYYMYFQIFPTSNTSSDSLKQKVSWSTGLSNEKTIKCFNLWQNIYCTNSHKIASFHVIGNNTCNTLILLSIIHVIKIFLKQFIPINFLEQKNLYDVWRYHQCCMSIPYIITTKLESKPVKNSH